MIKPLMKKKISTPIEPQKRASGVGKCTKTTSRAAMPLRCWMDSRRFKLVLLEYQTCQEIFSLTVFAGDPAMMEFGILYVPFKSEPAATTQLSATVTPFKTRQRQPNQTCLPMTIGCGALVCFPSALKIL